MPAQKNAGVTKKRFADADALIKAVRNGQTDELTLSRAELSTLAQKVDALEAAAADGAAYRCALLETAVKGFAKALPALDNRLAEQMCAPLGTKELKRLGEVLESAAPAVYVPQLCAQKQNESPAQNGDFKF